MAWPFARSFTVVFFSISAALLPSSLNAQLSPAVDRDSSAVRITDVTMPARGTSVDSLPAAGPRVARAGITAPVEKDRSGPASPQEDGRQVGAGSNVAMMGVGLAAIVVGSLVGGDGGTIIAIGGGVIGLIGLYRYLK